MCHVARIRWFPPQERPVLQSEPHAACNAVAPCYLYRVAIGNEDALLRPQDKETVRDAFGIAHAHCIRKRPAWSQQTGQQQNKWDRQLGDRS